MSKELDSEMELYGVSPNAIAIVMALVTLVLPVGGLNLIHIGMTGGSSFIYSALWVIFPSQGLNSLWLLMNPLFWISAVWATMPLCLLNLLYVRQLWRHYMGYSTKGSVLMVGLLSLIVPTAISIYITFGGLPLGVITPVPIQFVCGLVFLHRFREPELVSPWAGIYLDLSWWASEIMTEPQTPARLPSLSKLLEDHEADWLEGW